MENYSSVSTEEIISELMNAEEFGPALAGLSVMLVILGLTLVLSLVLYIFEGIGLHKMGRTCGIKAPWLAWLPIGNLYVIGALAQYDNRLHGRKGMPYAAVLPIGGGVISVLSGVVIVQAIGLVVNTVINDFSQNTAALDAEEAFFVAVGSLTLLSLLLMALSIAVAIIECVALYRVYHLFNENNAALCIVLSICFSIAIPIILFVLHNRQPHAPIPQPMWNPAYPYQPTYQPPYQPTAQAPYQPPYASAPPVPQPQQQPQPAESAQPQNPAE